MTTARVETRDEATSTYITVEQIVSADFYTAGARNLAHALVCMSDGSTFHVEGEQALALEKSMGRAELSLSR